MALYGLRYGDFMRQFWRIYESNDNLRYVAQFAKHFHTAPDRLDAEHIRTYQLHLLQQHVSKSLFIQTVCALRFFYETTLGRPWMADYIPYPKKPKTRSSSFFRLTAQVCYA